MESTTLIFDDWAMFLLENWKEARDQYNLSLDHIDSKDFNSLRDMSRVFRLERQLFRELLHYLYQLENYRVSRHRYGYPAYRILDSASYEALLRMCRYWLHKIIPYDNYSADLEEARLKNVLLSGNDTQIAYLQDI